MKAQMTATLRLPKAVAIDGYGTMVKPFAYRETFDYDEAGTALRRDEIRNNVLEMAGRVLRDKLYKELRKHHNHDAALLLVERCDLECEWHLDRPAWMQ